MPQDPVGGRRARPGEVHGSDVLEPEAFDRHDLTAGVPPALRRYRTDDR